MRPAQPILRLALALAAAASLGCGSGGRAPATDGATRTVRPSTGRSSEILTGDEIERASVATAYEAVERLRPAYLRTRSSGTMNTPRQFAVVYLDGANVGGLDALRRINARDVQSIRYLGGPDATLRYGTGHEGGAILVTTKP